MTKNEEVGPNKRRGVMRTLKLLVPVLFLVTTMGLPTVSLGSHIKATIGDPSVPGNTYQNDDAICSNCLYLDNAGGAAKQYSGNVSIAAKTTVGGQRARIEIGDDTQVDKIALVNAKITVSAPVTTEYRIAFWSTFNPNPTTGANVWYKLVGTSAGNLLRGFNAAGGDTVRARGSIEYTAGSGSWTTIGGGDLQKTISTGPAVNGNFFTGTTIKSLQWTGPLTQARVLRGEFWFTMQNTSDILSLPVGISVYNDTSGGGNGGNGLAGGVEEECPPCLIRTMPNWWQRFLFLFKVLPPPPIGPPPGPGPDPVQGSPAPR
jgi:hypothetical protein